MVSKIYAYLQQKTKPRYLLELKEIQQLFFMLQLQLKLELHLLLRLLEKLLQTIKMQINYGQTGEIALFANAMKTGI